MSFEIYTAVGKFKCILIHVKIDHFYQQFRRKKTVKIMYFGQNAWMGGQAICPPSLHVKSCCGALCAQHMLLTAGLDNT